MKKILTETSLNYANFLIKHWQADFEKVRRIEIEKFNNNCEQIRFNLNVILNTYLPIRKEKYLLPVRKFLYGHAAPLKGINTNYADYFSKKDSDAWSLEIFECCMLSINKMVDFESAKKELKELYKYFNDAYKSSNTQSHYIMKVINELEDNIKACLDFSERDEHYRTNEIDKNIIKPLNLWLHNLLNLIYSKIQQAYLKIKNKYPTQATEIFNKYIRIRELDENIKHKERYIYSEPKSAEMDYIICYDIGWSAGPSNSEIKREGKELYERGLVYKNENKTSQLEIQTLYKEITQLQLLAHMPEGDLKFISELVRLDWEKKIKGTLSILEIQFNNIKYYNHYDKNAYVDSKSNPLSLKFAGDEFLSSPIFEHLTGEDLDEIKKISNNNFEYHSKSEIVNPVNKNIFFYRDPARLPRNIAVQKAAPEFNL